MSNFHFNISLSVLNHLGRNLYRSFITVLGEAISNSWDADAENVNIFIDRENHNFVIIDDGDGMDSTDFSEKFLKIGYSKRKNGDSLSKKKGRPFIGRKGIGKLALLSGADRIHIISRKNETDEYIGGIIDNSDLEKNIKDDNIPEAYPLGGIDISIFKKYLKNHKKGTIIYFENITEGIKNQEDNLRKIIALYFRFSLIDPSFNIYLEKKKIDVSDLEDLGKNTEFFWNINTLSDPFLVSLLDNAQQILLNIPSLQATGFIASVKTPKNLSIFGAKERIGIDLFVNGRIREKDILKHIPTAQIAESYMYGQIHVDSLDDNDPKIDRFTSSRESIVADDPIFLNFLEIFRKDVLLKIVAQWDKLRLEKGKDGNPENGNMTRKQRAVKAVVAETAEEFTSNNPSSKDNNPNTIKWLKELSDDAEFNLDSYATCYLSENLLRKYLKDKNIELHKDTKAESRKRKGTEKTAMKRANIKWDIRKFSDDDLLYLFDHELFDHVNKGLSETKQFLEEKDEYQPIRNAVMHTSALSDEAKRKLVTIYDNIVSGIRKLLEK